MSKRLHIVVLDQQDLPLREETLDDRTHLVAPVIILVEGVHKKKLYTVEMLSDRPETWNGIPVVVQHPRENGEYVSANTPGWLESSCVGRLFNVIWDPTKRSVPGEIWIDIEKAQAAFPEVLEHLKQGRPLEVSTGLFTHEDQRPGDWNGEQYESTILTYTPDHLALLPGGGVGACSWQDGCGVRANAEINRSEPMNITEARYQLALAEKAVANELSHEDLRHQVQHLVDALDGGGWMHWVKDIYDSDFVYEAVSNNPSDGGSKLYRRTFSIDENDVVTMGDDAAEVMEQKEYVPVSNEPSEHQEGTTPAINTPCARSTGQEEPMDKKQRVDALIACENTPYTEDHREWLTSLEEDKLVLMEASDPPAVVPDAPVGDEPTPAEAAPAGDEPTVEAPATMESFLANAPSDIKETLTRALAVDASIHKKLVEALVAHPGCEFMECELKDMKIEALKKLVAMASLEVNYEGTLPVDGNDEDEAYMPAPLVFNLDRETAPAAAE